MADVQFFLNGNVVRLSDPRPDLLLIDFLRSPAVGLAGPKKACGQGGCGSCTVILSSLINGVQHHRAINSCLRPVCALNGYAITTVEGTSAPDQPLAAPRLLHSTIATFGGNGAGHPAPPAFVRAADAAHTQHAATSTSRSINEAAHALAVYNGSQCGYCSVGFVMNMSEYLHNGRPRLKREIEEAFDGNLCRCTGYRSIMAGMKSFATDLGPEDKKELKCEVDAITR